MVSPASISPQIDFAVQAGILDYFVQSAKKYGIPVSILLAIASRESGIGTDPTYLANNFTGGDGHGRGIMQIDDRWHIFAKITAPNDDQANILYGAEYLKNLLNQFPYNKQAAIAAYNAGPGNVRYVLGIGQHPDSATTGKDYSADVLKRAKVIKQLLKEKGIITTNYTVQLAALSVVGLAFYKRNEVQQWLNTI